MRFFSQSYFRPFHPFLAVLRALCVLCVKNSFVFFFLLTPVNPAWSSPEDEARIFNRQGVLFANRGDIDGAIKSFARAVKADPQDDTARANLATAYNNLGVHLCREGKFKDAIHCFGEARYHKPEDLQVRLNLLSALVSIRDGERVDLEARSILKLRPNDSQTLIKISNAFQRMEDVESARNLLEKIVSTEPKNAEALFCLGRLFYQQGNFSEARFNLERSIEISPANASATDLLRRIGREEGVETPFERENSIHFSITFEDQISRDWAKDLLDLFEDAYSKVGDFLNYYPSQKVQIIVYFPKNFQKVSTMPSWAGGLYDGKIRLPVPPHTQSSDQLHGAIFHEYCHHLVHVLSDGRCPTWLNEGLAQYVEGLDTQKARTILFNAGLNRLPSLKTMSGPFSKTKDRSEAERLYALSLWISGFLIDEKGVSAIQTVLAGLSQRQGLDDVLTAAFGYTCESLDSKVREIFE